MMKEVERCRRCGHYLEKSSKQRMEEAMRREAQRKQDEVIAWISAAVGLYCAGMLIRMLWTGELAKASTHPTFSSLWKLASVLGVFILWELSQIYLKRLVRVWERITGKKRLG